MQLEPGGGGDYVGIDPQLLGSMTSSMSSAAGTALNLVNSYIGRLSQVGLDTSSLSRAAQDLTWAQDQVPMLNRRQSIAQAMEQQDPGLGPMVSAGAGALDFATNQAAQAAGKAAGGKALQALEQHGNTDFILSDLSQYADDPAYLAAYFEALGPQGLAALGLQVVGYQQEGQGGQFQGWAGTVGNALAVASYLMPFTNDFLSGLQLPNDIDGSITPQLGLIQPFLEHGVYSSAWLQPLGRYALEQAYLQGRGVMMDPPPPLDGIWTAIAHNPAFDVQFYSHNFSNSSNPDFSISGIMTNPMLIHFICDTAFAGMVQAATIPPAGSTDTGPFAGNAQLTVNYFGADPSLDTSDQVRAALGAVAMNYFDDLAASVRAAAPGIGGQDMPGWQVTASSTDWGTFVVQAMKDKTTAAAMLTFYSAWAKSQPHDSWPSQGGGPEVPLNQGFWNDASLGMLRDFMAHSYQVAGAPAGDTSSIADIAAAGGAAVLGSLVFGPEGGIAAALLEGGKDAFKSAAETDLKQVFSSDPKPVNDQALTQLTGIQENWSSDVSQWYDGGNRAKPTTYMGQSYNGDPTTYISRYSIPGHDANFIKGGQIIDPAQMNAYQLAAYNAWLQDPAIVSANREQFFIEGYGGLLSQYSRSYSGGG